MQHLVKERGEEHKWIIDSAATADYNVGCPPDRRTIQVLEKNGIKGYKHKARLITDEDFNTFDMIFGMDHANISSLAWNPLMKSLPNACDALQPTFVLPATEAFDPFNTTL
ncbi:hypothetical protein C0Q70_05235 [Pomacea canaliculata]|uniref:Phosphotyrosine protein phosphatase I domain-containing protein n=1 Tax=Pomacea canaliculata TaxID=400727 RepID=A0A2T7PKM1_POMCA|nr:hypothetical protein C0Q70_05235 [Pomacea canaliculata]